jgi:hypothetical protein
MEFVLRAGKYEGADSSGDLLYFTAASQLHTVPRRAFALLRMTTWLMIEIIVAIASLP